jgi:hypothetical protein
MTDKIERVAPQIVEGIEFYVSHSGEQTGLSQVGLAKLVGKSEYYVRRRLSDRSKAGKTDYYDSLNPDVASGRAIVLTSNQNARVVTAKACAQFIRDEASKGNQIAGLALDKFLDIGFSTWVKKIVGFGSGQQLDSLQKTLEQVLGAVGNLTAEFQEMRQETASYRRVVVRREGLKDWMELENLQADCELLEPGDDFFTLAEYLEQQKGMRFSKSQMSLFALKVSYVYRTMSKEAPARKRGKRNDGRLAPEINAYTKADFPILDLAYKQTVIEF